MVAKSTNGNTPATTNGVATAPSVGPGATARVPKHNKIKVESIGNFPMAGSQLGDYFCLGKLGKGTFCSIHKCCALNYWRSEKKARVVAAKVELSNFTNSGVLEGEAQMLNLLDTSLPPDTVPFYLGHLYSKKYSAILMEFLGGDDMHQLREELGTRRISVEDAVFLTADILIPLLQEMHKVGVVHRDVKPSNCVRREGKKFLLVDFGLSKSIIVPKDSPYSGSKFTETHCLRKEREKADFRGTSMYASLRVHQLKDYTFRDDMWSVLYVFCDLISGGLPWMSYAANRERDTCEKMKHDIFENKKTEDLLKGEAFHIIQFKRDKMAQDGRTDLPDLPIPLDLSKDKVKVELLTKAFDHMGQLGFNDMPDYDLLQRCLRGFLEGKAYDEAIPRMRLIEEKTAFSPQHEGTTKAWGDDSPVWELRDVLDPLDSLGVWKDVANQAESEESDEVQLSNDVSEFVRLPIEHQFRIAQMKYHTQHSEDTPHHIALRDFMKVALPLVYEEWDSANFEKGNHRSNNDGYRRELFLKIVDICLDCASSFQDFFTIQCYHDTNENPKKKRRIFCTHHRKKDQISVSAVILGLQSAKLKEKEKRSAPPPALRFSQG